MSWISDAIAKHFPALNHDYFAELLSPYDNSGLAPPNFRSEIIGGSERAFWAHVWEAMLFRHLSALGFEFRKGHVTKAGQHGPDFGIIHNGRTIWIEAVVPGPEGIPPDSLELPKTIAFRAKPYDQILLRWTSVLKDKREKLQRYLDEEIVSPDDATVIAINGSRLSYWFHDDHGTSWMPLAVEATFPIGQIAFPISLGGEPAGEPARIPRYSIQKPNGADVPTDSFLNLLYANVSAVIGSVRRGMDDPDLTLVHNPLAHVALPRELLGATKEYVADDAGDRYLLRPLSERAE
jgi:type I restriction enzyme S subunit